MQTLATFDVSGILIYDKEDFVMIKSGEKHVYANLKHGGIGAGQLKHMPIDFTTYNLQIKALSMAEIDAIEQWYSAERVTISVDTKPSEAVFNRVQELKLGHEGAPCFIAVKEFGSKLSCHTSSQLLR